MNNFMDFYKRKSIQELAAKYVLFQNDTETGHTEAMCKMFESMCQRIGMENTQIELAKARDVYRMLVPPTADRIPF
jgi:hypothetical protein